MWFRNVLLLALLCLAARFPARSQKLAEVFSLPVSEIGPTSVLSNGRTAVVGFRNRTDLLVMDVSTGLPLRRLQGHQQPVQYLVFDELNNQLISVASGEILLWQIPGFRLIEKLSPEIGKDQPLSGYTYDPSRQLLFAASAEEVLVYSLRQKGLGKSFRNREETGLPLLALAPEGETLWTLYPESGVLQGISLTNFRPERKITLRGAEALATDGKRVAVLKRSAEEADYQMVLFDRRLSVLDTFRMEGLVVAGSLPQLQFSGPERLSLAINGELLELDLRARETRRFVHGRPPGQLSFLADGSMVLSARQGLQVIDRFGRLEKQLTKLAEFFVLKDADAGRRFILKGDALLDEKGRDCLRLLPEDQRPICADLRGALLVVGTGSGELSVYDWQKGQRLARWKVQGPPLSQIHLLSDAWIAGFTAGQSEWNILDLHSGKPVKKWMTEEGSPTAMAVKGAFLYLGDSQGGISQFGILDTCLEVRQQWLTNPVTALEPLPSDSGLVVGSREGIWLCALPELRPFRQILGHDNAITFLEADEESRQLISMAGDGSVRLWDLRKRQLLEQLELKDDLPLDFSFSLTDDEDGLLLTQQGKGYLLSREKFPTPPFMQSRRGISGGNSQAMAPVFNRDGSLLATLDVLANTVFIWDAKTLHKLYTIYPGPGLDVRRLAFFGENEVLLLAGNQVAEYWDPSTGRNQKRIDYRASQLPMDQLQPGSNDLWTLAPHHEQVLRIAPGSGDLAEAWRLSTAGQDRPETLQELALSADGRRLAVSGTRGIYWRNTDGQAPWEIFVDTFRNAEIEQVKLAFSPDGALLACLWKEAGEITVVDPDQGQVRLRLTGESATFLDDRRILIFRSRGMPQPVLDIWDCWKGSPVATFEGMRLPHIAAHGASGRVAAANIRGELKLWLLQANPLGDLQLIPVERVEKPASGRKLAQD